MIGLFTTGGVTMGDYHKISVNLRSDTEENLKWIQRQYNYTTTEIIRKAIKFLRWLMEKSCDSSEVTIEVKNKDGKIDRYTIPFI